MTEQLCRCVDVDSGTFAHTVTMVRRDRLIAIDVCIATEIAELWHLNVKTAASCCGHGKYPSNVIVEDEYNEFMPELGYVLLSPAKPSLYPATWLLPSGRRPAPGELEAECGLLYIDGWTKP